MRNKILLRVAQVVGFVATAALFPSAHAVQITLSLPDCPGGQALTFSSATNTLSCGGQQPQVLTPSSCSVQASPPSEANNGLAANTEVTLTALCTAGATPVSYTWNIGVVGPSLTVAPASTTTYVVTPKNSSGTGATFQTTVYIGNGNPTGNSVSAPSGCSISQTPNTASSPVSPGATVTLAAFCSAGHAATSCSWSNGISGNACTVNLSAPSQTTSYSVNATNSGGTGTASTTVSVNPTTGSGSQIPTTGQNFCTGSDSIVNVNWPSEGQSKQRTNGFGNQRIAFRIVVPAIGAMNPPLNINHLGLIRIAEVPGGAVVTRDFTVSKNACDFQSNSYLVNGIAAADTAPTVTFTVNNPLGYLAVGGSMNAAAGETFYVNVRNYYNTTPTCPYSSCDLLFDFATPNRY